MPLGRWLFYAATLAGIVVAVRSVVRAPPPLSVAVFVTLAYVALLAASVFILRLRVFLDAVTRGHAAARGVALTFDGALDPTRTVELLDALAAKQASATFFVFGAEAGARPDLVRDIVRRGHALGVQSFTEGALLAARPARHIRVELVKALEAIEPLVGERPRLFRPPRGTSSPSMARVVDELDLVVVGWSKGELRDGAILRMPADAPASEVAARLEAIAAANLDVVPLAALVGDGAGG